MGLSVALQGLQELLLMVFAIFFTGVCLYFGLALCLQFEDQCLMLPRDPNKKEVILS